MSIASPVDPSQHVLEKPPDVMNVEQRVVLLGHNEKVLGQRKLPLPKDCGGLREQFLRAIRLRVRRVPLTTDRKQKRVHSRFVDRVYGLHSRQHGRNDRPGDLVNDFPERRVLLRWPPNDRERPDGISPVVHPLNVQHGKVVGQAVIAQVVSEWTFGKKLLWIDRSGDTEVGFRVNGQAEIGRGHGHSPVL